MGLEEHRSGAIQGVRCAIITVSDSRTLDTDASGRELARRIEAAGHRAVMRTVISDEPGLIAEELKRFLADSGVDAILMSGGTGLAPRDTTVEAVRPLLNREIPGFGELFRFLSHARIGSAAMLSRAVAGVAAGKPVFCLPGSLPGVILGLEELILPELGHILQQIRL